LRKLNIGQYRAYFVDENNNMIGTYDSEGNFMGVELEFFYASIWKVNEGTKPAVFTAEFAVNDAKELNDKVAVYKPDFDVKDSVLGILNLELVNVAQAAGKVTVQVVTEGDQVNLYDDYSAELAVVGMWLAINVATGLPVAATTVAVNAAKKAFDVTLPAGTYKLSLVSAEQLADTQIGGAPSSGYESLPIIVTIT